MTRKEIEEYEKMLTELQRKLWKDSGAQNVGELMRTNEAQAYIASVQLLSKLYELMPPWD